jgi:phage shock protein PspC (stress-responsive transcriptional regulator)
MLKPTTVRAIFFYVHLGTGVLMTLAALALHYVGPSRWAAWLGLEIVFGFTSVLTLLYVIAMRLGPPEPKA